MFSKSPISYPLAVHFFCRESKESPSHFSFSAPQPAGRRDYILRPRRACNYSLNDKRASSIVLRIDLPNLGNTRRGFL